MATSIDARGDSSHRKRWVLRRWKMAIFRRNWFHYYLRLCTELQVLSKTASRLWFYAYKNTRTGTARRTYLQCHIWPSITQNVSDNFQFGNIRKFTKNSNFKSIFSRRADRIAVKFCMTIQKIKSNDIFQNCVYSTSTLKLFYLLHDNQFSCPISSLLHISLQSCYILLHFRKINVFFFCCWICAYFRNSWCRVLSLTRVLLSKI